MRPDLADDSRMELSVTSPRFASEAAADRTPLNPIVCGQSRGWGPEYPVFTRRDRPVQLERHRLRFAASSGSFADASFSAAFRYSDVQASRPSRTAYLSLRALRPFDGAHGVLPFAGLIPPTGDRDISVRPGPRVVRAFSSAPINFRRGGRGRLSVK
jgi:hypothetical protein